MGLYGKYKGICTNNTDPDGLLRIKVRIPGLIDEELAEWAWPCLPPAITYTDQSDSGTADKTAVIAPPDVGSGVWVEFEAGDVNAPIWSGVWFA